MNKKHRDLLSYIDERKTNFIIGLVGVVIVLLGVIAGIACEDDIAEAVLLGVGCSLIASAVVSYLTSIYMFRRRLEKEVTDTWGVLGVFHTRAEMNINCDESLARTTQSLSMIGFGFGSLRGAKRMELEEKVGAGLRVRILVPHPDAPCVAQRDRVEKDVPGHTRESICNLAKWVEVLQGLSPQKDNVQIKYYDTAPLDFLFITDDRLYTGPYMYGKLSQQTISYEFSATGEGYRYYQQYFEDLWKDDPEGLPKLTYSP